MRLQRTALILLVVLVASAGLLFACDGRPAALAPMTAKIKPPFITKAGVLRAAIDLDYPPLGGTVGGVDVGLDVDVASAIAERLGLRLEIVDARPAEGVKLLSARKVDVLLAGLPIDQAVQSDIAFAGSYVNDAPAAFSANPGSISLYDLDGKKVAVQAGSQSFGLMAGEFGEDAVTPLPTLREAFAAVVAGRADYAVGDGLVGGYMLRDFPKVRFNGQLAPAVPVGVGVDPENTDLESAVRDVLDKLAAQGVLETLRCKWVGDLPRLSSVAESSGLEATRTFIP